MSSKRSRPDWFYLLMLVYTGLHLAWMVVLFFDFFRAPFEHAANTHSLAYRWFVVFGLTPASLLIAVLVLRRTPGNVIGLCLLLLSTLTLGQTVPESSPIYVLNIPLNTGWTGLWLLGLFFPDGHPAFKRFEGWIRGVSGLTILSVGTWFLFQPTLNNFNASHPENVVIHNPLFISALHSLQQVINPLEMVSLAIVIILIIPSILVRYRNSSQTVRLQVKWLTWTYGILMASLVFYAPTGLLSGDPHKYGVPGFIAVQIFGVFVSLAPFIAVGNAILRHRLYDIDLIIRRTLVYGVLTGLLGLLYLGAVTVLQGVFASASGQSSTFAIVLSTLAIAALFNPLRQRIQEFIDRRFYRQKFNAERTLASFAQAARSEMDLEQLSSQMILMVQKTVQPEHLSLWLKPITKAREKK
jgi:hypothetical protein